METILKVGDKAKGFKFADETYKLSELLKLHYHRYMDSYIGQIGKIVRITERVFVIEFADGRRWDYPLSLMHLAVVEEPKVIEIDFNNVEKFEYLLEDEWVERENKNYAKKYRFTMKDESKLKIEKEIEELENIIKELKSKL